jgi:hypothetical protein
VNEKTTTLKKQRRSILWVSNAPWARTGYGTQTAQSVTRLKKDNHDVAIAANYGLEGSNTSWNSEYGAIPIFPRGLEQWSNDIIPAHAHSWFDKNKNKENLIITLFDVWVFKGDKWSDFPVASWTPVDHMPAPPDVASWCKKDSVYPIAMSQFGKAMFDNLGIESWYVPHAVEKVFKPTILVELPDKSSISGRKIINIPEDKFVVGMNAANKGVMPNRKAFGENLLAFSMFAQKHDDAVLYMHCESSAAMGGINIKELMIACGIPKEKVIFADPYLMRTGVETGVMAAIYSAMDVLLATSYGEGFGVPTIEAQACGVPVIVSDFTASAELCGDGWKISGQPLWDAYQKAFFQIPFIPEIVDALEESYKRGRSTSKKAIEFAKKYEADTVYQDCWKPTLDSIFNKIGTDSLKTA